MPEYVGDQVALTPLETPEAPTLTLNGATGATTYGYKVVAKRGDLVTDASAEETIETGPTTLTTARYVKIRPPYVQGATGYDIYRTTGGMTQGKIGSMAPLNRGTSQTRHFSDTGIVADDSDAPAVNQTGQLVAGGVVMLSDLPDPDPGVAGQVYHTSGTLHVSEGD